MAIFRFCTCVRLQTYRYPRAQYHNTCSTCTRDTKSLTATAVLVCIYIYPCQPLVALPKNLTEKPIWNVARIAWICKFLYVIQKSTLLYVERKAARRHTGTILATTVLKYKVLAVARCRALHPRAGRNGPQDYG